MPASAHHYRPETRLVHAGTLRSQFGETSEALFLTQGYVYDSSAQAERALQGRGAGLPLFALRQSDGRDVRGAHGRARRRRSRARDRDRHGGGDASRCSASSRPAITWSPRRRCSAPAATWSRISCRATASPRRWSTAPISAQWKKAVRPNTKTVLPRKPDQSDAGGHRHRRGREDRPCGRRDAGGRQRVRDAAVPAAARARRGLRRLFGDQAHRRPGPLPRRRHPRLGEIHPGQRAQPASARPARRSRRSTPGCCSRAWRR